MRHCFLTELLLSFLFSRRWGAFRCRDGLFSLGLILGQRQDFAGAEARHRAAIEIEPAFTDALHALGDLLHHTGKANDVSAPSLHRHPLGANKNKRFQGGGGGRGGGGGVGAGHDCMAVDLSRLAEEPALGV